MTQKSVTSLTTQAIQDFADNSTGDITAQDLRVFLLDLLNSVIARGTNTLTAGGVPALDSDGQTMVDSGIEQDATNINFRKRVACPDDSGLSVGGMTLIGAGDQLALRQPDGNIDWVVTYRVNDATGSLRPTVFLLGSETDFVVNDQDSQQLTQTSFQFQVSNAIRRIRSVQLNTGALAPPSVAGLDLIVRRGSHTSEDIVYQYTRATGGEGFILRSGNNNIASSSQLAAGQSQPELPGDGFAHKGDETLFFEIKAIDGSTTFQLAGSTPVSEFIPDMSLRGNTGDDINLTTSVGDPGPDQMLVTNAWRDLFVLNGDGVSIALPQMAASSDSTQHPVSQAYINAQDFPVDANYVHTDNNFTDALRTKLENLIPHFQGVFEDASARDAAVLTPQSGFTALLIDNGASATELFYYNGVSWIGTGSTSTGDMLSTVYDPTGVGADAFDMDNMVEGATNLILTAAERAKLADIFANLPAGTIGGQVMGWDPDQNAGAGAWVSIKVLAVGPAGERADAIVDGASNVNPLHLTTKAYADAIAGASNPALIKYSLVRQSAGTDDGDWRHTPFNAGQNATVGIYHNNSNSFFAVTNIAQGDYVIFHDTGVEDSYLGGKVTAAVTNDVGGGSFETVLTLAEIVDQGAFVNGAVTNMSVTKGAVDGVNEFTNLTDTPSSFSGRSEDVVTVNTDEDALVFTPKDTFLQEITEDLDGVYRALKFLEPQLPENASEAVLVDQGLDPVLPNLTMQRVPVTANGQFAFISGQATEGIQFRTAEGTELDQAFIDQGLTGSFSGTSGPLVRIRLYVPLTDTLIVDFTTNYQGQTRGGGIIEYFFSTENTITSGAFPEDGFEMRLAVDRTYTTVQQQIDTTVNAAFATYVASERTTFLFQDPLLGNATIPDPHVEVLLRGDAASAVLNLGVSETFPASVASGGYQTVSKAFAKTLELDEFQFAMAFAQDNFSYIGRNFSFAELLAGPQTIFASTGGLQDPIRITARIFESQNQLGGVDATMDRLLLAVDGAQDRSITIGEIIGIHNREYP